MNYFNEVNKKAKQELIEHIANGLQDLRGSNTHVCDLHHELFNTDYYIIGYYQAKQKLKEWGLDSLDAVNMIQEYEVEQFGEVTKRELNHENVLNMVVYILGEEIMNSCDLIQDYWNCTLDDYEEVEALDGLTLDQALINYFNELNESR